VTEATRKRVFITGASSGIGCGLAHEYAARGFDLALASRRGETLDTLRAEIRGRHAACVVHTHALDVTHYEEVFATLNASKEQFGQLDIVIANAGIGGVGRVGMGNFDTHRAIIETNVIGTMATSDAAIKLFKQQGFGHLVVISSVAAFRGLPTSSAYSASKAAIAVYADAIRAEIYGSRIKVTTIYPGYIDTPINQHMANRPFLISVQRGAKIIVDKIERGVQSAIVPAFPWSIVARVARLLPTSVLAKGMGSK